MLFLVKVKKIEEERDEEMDPEDSINVSTRNVSSEKDKRSLRDDDVISVDFVTPCNQYPSDYGSASIWRFSENPDKLCDILQKTSQENLNRNGRSRLDDELVAINHKLLEYKRTPPTQHKKCLIEITYHKCLS